MNLTTLFFNAMRMTNKIDCRRFAVDPAYQQTLQSELFGDVASRRPACATADEYAPRASLRRMA
jgi:hypothetical protein